MRKICIATGTRADWGLLSPIAKALKVRDDVKLSIVATNMHLAPRYGNTYKEILADGFKIDCHVPLLNSDDTPADTVKSMSMAMSGFSAAFEELTPDLLIILGDRYEMLAVASTALIFKIPIVHIAGGAISEGAYDDSIRHAITKMSHIHLTETEEYRNRVIQLGENPEHVFNTGAIGIHNILNTQYLEKSELEKEIGLKIDGNTLMVTFHPATLDDVDPGVQCRNMLAAFDKHTECNIIFSYPNNDTNGKVIIEAIEKYADMNPERCKVFPSLGLTRYLSVLRYAGAVVGNSSSGIVEVPSMHIPTLDIGSRQRNRIAADSVLHCGVGVNEIEAGLDTILSDEWRKKARETKNPYYKADTLEMMVNAICDTPLEGLTMKHFYDLKR